MANPNTQKNRKPRIDEQVWKPELVQRVQHLWPEIAKLLGPRAKVHPEFAMGSILLTATYYQELSQRYRRAPSRRRLYRHLELLRDSACLTMELLKHPEPYFLAALSMHGLPEDELVPFKGGFRIESLERLARLCLAAHKALLNLPLTGPASGQTASGWPPKRALAFRCLEIFERYQPGAASTTAGGAYRTFVNYVYEIATGEEADLEKPVKEAIKLSKKQRLPKRTPFADVIHPHRKLVRELDALRRS
jgi:hypothetical protein